jgi:hypothetical protein
MISSRTLASTKSAVDSGRVIKLSPFMWDPTTQMFNSTPEHLFRIFVISRAKSGTLEIVWRELEIRSWKCILYFVICFKYFLIAYWIIFLILNGSSHEENVLLVFLSSNCLTSLCVQIMYLSSHKEIVGYLNTLLIFDRKLGNYSWLNKGIQYGVFLVEFLTCLNVLN